MHLQNETDSKLNRPARNRLVLPLIGLAFACHIPAPVHSQSAWSPQKNVEFIVPTAAGSTMDALARIIQDIWQKNRLVNASMTVMVKPGSGGAIAWTYVSRKTGDGHFIAISGPTLLANDIMRIGDLSYRDVTPIAQLFTEYTAFAVPADGPIKTGVDLVKALKGTSPPSVGIAPGFGSSSHVALLKLASAAGIDPGHLTVVPFKGANESVTAALGGHIDVTIATMAVLAPMLDSGKLRPIAVTAPARRGGSQSVIPTWREQGFDVIEGNWRGVVGPKNLGSAEVAFWNSRLIEAAKSADWDINLKRNHWDADFMGSADSKRFLDRQYEELKSTLSVLRLSK